MEWTPDKGRVFTGADWSDLNARGISSYYRSKVSQSLKVLISLIGRKFNSEKHSKFFLKKNKPTIGLNKRE